MQYTPVFLHRYIEAIKKLSDKTAAGHPSTLMTSSGRDEVFYCPFEWTNKDARLVIVGINRPVDGVSSKSAR